MFHVLFFITLFTFHTCLNIFDQSQCGHTKSCLRWSSCDTYRCDFGYSWKMIEYNYKRYLEIEMVGKLEQGRSGYIALGFGAKEKMNDNGVVACVILDGVLNISCGHNGNHYNSMFNSSNYDSNFLLIPEDPTYGIEYDSSTNSLRCKFLRLMTPIINSGQLKDLYNNQYYLLSSTGGVSSPLKLLYHFTNKRVTTSTYDLSSSVWVNNIITGNYLLIKLHASFMVLGWLLFATNGIIVALFYKENWTDRTIFRGKVWFQVHRLLQTGCVLSVVTGFVLIFVKVGGYSSLGSLPNTAHPILGITATALMVINPIMALFRCKPDDSSRWIFNGLHFVVGISAYLIAISAMSIGIQLPPAGPYLPNMNAPWICVLVFLTLIILLFSYGMIRRWRKTKILGTSINQTEPNNQGGAETDSKEKQYLFSQSKEKSSGYDILLGSIIFSTIFFIVLITFIAKY